MLDIFNLVLGFLTLTFYFNKVIEKFNPCLNIILLSLFLIAYSMSNTQYLLGSIVVIILFYFLVPNNKENFAIKRKTYHLIDSLDTILLDDERRNDKTKPIVFQPLNSKDIIKIKKTGKFRYPGEKSVKDIEMIDNKFDPTQSKDNGWRIVENINNLGEQPTEDQKMKIYSIQKINGFNLVRMDSSQEKNEEEYIMNKLIQYNKKQGNDVEEPSAQNTTTTNSSAMKMNKDQTESTDDTPVETFVSKRKKKSKKSSKKKRKSYGFDQEFNVDESFINNKETLGDVYRSLDPDQAKGLNSDTKELLETQKNLMNTLKEMGPVLTQGKDIMNTFNKYFGKTK